MKQSLVMNIIYFHSSDAHHSINTKLVDVVRVVENRYGVPTLTLEKITDNGETYTLYTKSSESLYDQSTCDKLFKIVSEFVHLGIYDGMYVPDSNLSVTITNFNVQYRLTRFMENQLQI